MELRKENIDYLRSLFVGSKDLLLRNFPATLNFPFELAAELLLPHISGRDITLRYLSGGYTEATVLLVRPADHQPFVIKFGPLHAMEEHNKHLSDDLPFYVRPQRLGASFQSKDRKYESFAYTWAGGNYAAPQLREAINDDLITADALIQAVLDLMLLMSDWSSPIPVKNKSIFDLWDWEKEREDLGRIRTNLANLKNSANAERIAKLEGVIDYELPWQKEAPVLSTVQGNCHGDLNSRNVIISGPREHLSARVIDISDAKIQNPAYDWARLERDVKLLCLRDKYVDANEYADKLTDLNRVLKLGVIAECPSELEKYARLILAIREQYEKYYGKNAKIDYLYMLLCWNIAHINSHQWQNERDITAKLAIVESAYETFSSVNAAVAASRNPKIESTFISSTPVALERRHQRPSRNLSILIVAIALIGSIGVYYYANLRQLHLVYVHAFDASGNSVSDAKIECSVPCFIKAIDGYWEVEIPGTNIANNHQVTIKAAVPERFLQGSSTVQISSTAENINIKLFHPEENIHGVLIDEAGQPLPYTRIAIATFPGEAVNTSSAGEFSLQSHAAIGETVRLAVLDSEVELLTDFYRAGNNMQIVARRLHQK